MHIRSPRLRALALVLAAVAQAGWSASLAGQAPEVWNEPRVLDLVRRARLERSSTLVDTAFHSYAAQARGFVYFFIDRPDTDERTLVKADQIALEVFWRAPSETQQRIVGLRDQKVLPTNIRYHLDHLTVVQDDFGDQIRLGHGDEVAAVLHPMGPGGPAIYDYLLADSLTLRYGGDDEEVRVYEVRVRPKDPNRAGFIGSVFVDRAAAAIVRMSFTFTPASYVDPYLDYIRIALDNSLWLGKYWLPYRQEAELRRELPQLDFLAGSIIRGRFEIGSYEFNTVQPPATFVGSGVTAVPREQREAFPFERGLFDDLEQEGLTPTPSLEEIRAQARQILVGKALSGLAPYRLHFRSFSDGLRYNRAEGLFAGAGIHLNPRPDALIRLSGGYAVGRKRPSLSVAATTPPARVVPVVEAYWDDLRDMGAYPGAAPVLGSLGAVFTGEDYLDPYFARGAQMTLSGANPGQGAQVTLRWERHTSARNLLSEGRAVRAVSEGFFGTVQGRVPLRVPGSGEGTLTGTVGRFGGGTFGTALAEAGWTLDSPARSWRLRADVAAGASTLRTPPQMLFLLGGRGTIPGYDYRSFVGRRFWMARVEGTRPLLHPWVGVRAFAALGATSFAGATPPPAWSAHDSDGRRASVGIGLSLGWDVLRLDVARGLQDGRWDVIFEVNRRFHPWL
ncbi:MAG: hypothetical protein Q8N53_02130 [Longimicrobiales bacterium]|nr:hypothetical protein [Longimicrobiales bacterium]